MASNFGVLICAVFCVTLATSENIDFGSKCGFSGISVDCLVPLIVNDCNIQDQLSGFITSPDFPLQTNNAQLGKYRATISSCPDSLISITLSDENFSLGTENNYFTVGNGLTVGSNSIPPVLRGKGGDNELPDGKTSYQYLSSSNSTWIEANLPEGRAFFKIQFIIIPLSSNIHYYYGSSGELTSPDYGTSYPSQANEDTSLIDVTTAYGDYVDLLLTINEFDVKGINGDYVKLGPGLDWSDSKNSAVISWQLKKGIQFLISGPRAHVYFKVLTPIDFSQKAKGFSIFYQVIEKNLTTPAPSTTPMPTSPTPLPYDSNILLTDLVYLNYVSNSSRSELVEVLNKYAESTGMLQDGEIVPELSDASIDIVTLKNCYHGWDIDPETCGQVQVIVRAFYQKTGDDEITYAFPREKVRAAVKMHGSIHQIYLPEDFTDMYWVMGGVSVAVIFLIVIGLFTCWRQKLRRESSKRSKYHELSNRNLSTGGGSDITKVGPTKTNFEIRTTSAFDNPTFTIEEEEYSNGRPVMTYDPEKSMAHSRSFGHDRIYTQNTPRLSEEPELERSSLNNSAGHSKWMPSFMSKLDSRSVTDEDTDSSVYGSSTMPPSDLPKRGILKSGPVSSNARGFTNADNQEDVLYDSSEFKEIPLHRYSSSSDTVVTSSEPSRTNSISTDQQIGSHAVLYGITLTGLDSDDENETNL